MVRRAPAAVLALLAIGTSACSGGSEPADPPTPTASSATAPTTPATPTSPSSSAAPGLPPGGTQERPAAVDAPLARLGWRALSEDPSTRTVTVLPTGRVDVDRAGRTATVTDARGSYGLSAPVGFRWNDVVSNGSTLVLNAQDRAEEQPSRATVVTLADRTRRTLDGSSRPATVNGGAWAVDDTTVFHATTAGGRYCLAAVALADLSGRTTYCVNPRAGGFSDVVSGPDGTSLLTFSGRPQCRTPARLAGSAAEPLVGVTRCTGWDAALLPDGAVWSVVPKPNQVETARFYARAGDAFYDLGLGSTGTLVRCGSAAYFTRDADRDIDSAAVLRWSPTSGLSTVYTSPGPGPAFVAEPRCAGDRLTISSFGEGGDEQVWATVS